MLYRTNAQSRQIEEALRRYGRKYVVVGGFSFYQRAEVKDVSGVSESPGQPAGFGQPAAHHQYAGARHRPHHGGADRAVRACSISLSLWTALDRMLEERAFPRPRRSRAGGVSSHDGGAGRASRNAAALPRPLRDVLERTGYRKMLEEENTEEVAGAPGQPRRTAERRRRRSRARRNHPRFSGSRRAGVRRRFGRRARAGFAADHAQRQGPGISGGVHRGPGRRSVSAQPVARFRNARWKRSAASVTSA